MRITYDNTPVLKALNDDAGFKLWNINEFKKDNISKKEELFSKFKQHRENYKSVYLVSKNYHKSAVYKAEGFLMAANQAIEQKKPLIPKGTFIAGQFVFFFYTNYQKEVSVSYCFTRGGKLVSVFTTDEFPLQWVSSLIFKDFSEEQKIAELYQRCICYWMFKYSNYVEQKIVARDKKVKCEGEAMPVMNKLDFDIVHLNSMYYTEIIRNEAFGVTGHYRYYPPKLVNGEWVPHIIWIDPYMKKGYHRRAQKTIEKQKS